MCGGGEGGGRAVNLQPTPNQGGRWGCVWWWWGGGGGLAEMGALNLQPLSHS